MMVSSRRWLVGLLLIGWPGLMVPLTAAELVRLQQTQSHMGTYFTLTLYATDPQQAERAFAAAFVRIQQLDECLSNYRPDSEVNRLSASSPHAMPVPLTADVWQVLHRSEQYSHLSDGAFDVTVGPVTKLWRRARRTRRDAGAERLGRARAAVGYTALKLDADHHTAQMLRPEMLLDLGGIGAGFALDAALQALREHGVTRALLDGGGDVLAGEPPPDKPGWTIGIANVAGQTDESSVIECSGKAVTTSGDLFQFVEIDGVRYSHIVDPRTGLGLTHRSTVTVLAADATAADALATAVCVLGPERGLELIESLPDAEVLMTVLEQDQARTYRSDGFPALGAAPEQPVPSCGTP